MQFRTKIVGFAVLMAGGAAVCAKLTLVLAQGIERRLESVDLAENQLALYLAMETNIGDLLRLQVTAIAAPSDTTAARLAETRAMVRGDVEAIRGLVEQEIALRGDAEAVDLGRLSQINAVLDDFDAALEYPS